MKTLSPVRACLLSVACPGFGELYAGHRRLGWSLILVFSLVAVLMMVGAYGSVQELIERAGSRDASLAEVPRDGVDLASHLVRLSGAVLTEYRREAGNIRRRVGWPMGAIAFLYLLSVIQSPILALRANRLGDGAADDAPVPDVAGPRV